MARGVLNGAVIAIGGLMNTCSILARFRAAFLTVFVTFEPICAASSIPVFLDTHVHVNNFETGRAGVYLDQYFALNLVEKAFLVSPSYLLNLQFDYIVDEKAALAADKEVSRLVSDDPKRLRGICGFNWKSSQAVEVLSRCMGLPGMVGLKLRYYGPDDLFTASVSTIRTAARSHPNLKFVLVHMPLSIESVERNRLTERDVGNINALAALALEFPGVQWIAAHSFYSPEMVVSIAGRNLKNIWIEISTAFINLLPMEEDKRKDRINSFIASWRAFDMERILFGSDVTADTDYRSIPSQVPTKTSFSFDGFDLLTLTLEELARSGLTDDERLKIQRLNGIRFWNLIDNTEY